MEELFLAMACASFLEFTLFAMIEMRCSMLVWRAQRENSNSGGNTHREMATLYSAFYGILLAGRWVGGRKGAWVDIC